MTGGEARDDLTRFVREHKQTRSVSYRDLADRAVDPGTRQSLGFQWLDRLANNQIAKAPDPWQLRALAAALGVDADVVKALAARQWLEYESKQLSLGTPWDWVLYPQVRDMPEADQATLRLIVVAFIRRQAQREAQEEADAGDGRDAAAHA